ncbi:hypothetical protein ACHAPT_006351 [Fusarium lateritium]
MEAPSTPAHSPSAELLLVSPLVGSASGPRSRKRQVTPSYEASSPKRIGIIVQPGVFDAIRGRIQRPFQPNPLRWPAIAQEAFINARQPLILNPLRGPHPPTRPPDENSLFIGSWPRLFPEARHITLPFDLRRDPTAMSNDENRELLSMIFPDTTGVGGDGFFLYIYVSRMPPKPWPKTIAGLPLILAPSPGPEHSPIPTGRLVRGRNGEIAEQMNGRDMEPWTPLFEAVRDHFIALDISITQVIYWGNFLTIVLEHRDTDMTKLPWRAARISCQYLYDDEMGTPRWPQARRQTDPTPGHPDQNQYTTLQPGLRITSGYLPGRPGMFQATTTGVLVKDTVGNEFMTVAAHGFTGECGAGINHALPTGGRRIGQLIYEVSHTDIALVKLEPHEKFANVSFESEYIAEPLHLKQLIKVDKLKQGDLVFLDSPDTGCLEGTLQGRAYQRVPTDDPNVPQQRWAFVTWFYMGQDSGINLPPGMCGSAIWNEDGDVVGFFRYAPAGGGTGIMKDWCAATAADELINRGFSLVDTSNQEL